MGTNNPIKAVQRELNPIMQRLSEHVDKRAVRNIGKVAVGIINARSTRISEITHKSKRKCKRLITDAKRNYRMLKSKTWEQARGVVDLADAVRDNFGAAIIVLSFLGMTLFALSLGFSNLSPIYRFIMMCVILGLIISILIALFYLRIWKPSGLGGPPSPSTVDVTFKDTSIS